MSTQWLCDHLGSDGLLVVDATVVASTGPDGRVGYVSGAEQYLAGHVPGAVFADLLDPFSDPAGRFPFTRPGAEGFAAAAAALGVEAGTTVVIYDAAVGQWASRLWWLFRSFGFDVRVLDGGLAKWRAEGRPVATGDVRPRRAGDFSAYSDDEAWADKHEVAAAVAGETDSALVCGLPAHEFWGDSAKPRTGHIPGSISVPVANLIDPVTNAFRPVSELRETLGEAFRPGAPVIVYCRSGIASASVALALTLIGQDGVRIYDASLNEWAADASAPLETGAQQLAASGGVRHLRRPE